MANKKRYYFVEVSIPDAVKDAYPDKHPAVIMKDLREAWKDEVATKYARALSDFIYEDVKIYGWHPTDANKTAYCMTFINARHFENYQAYSADFRTWLNDNHGITYTYEVTTDVPYDIEDKDNLGGAEVESEQGNYFTYAEAKRKAILEDLPEERGFLEA